MNHTDAVLALMRIKKVEGYTGYIRRAKWDTIPRDGMSQHDHYARLNDFRQENCDADDWEFYEPEPYKPGWYDPETGLTYEDKES